MINTLIQELTHAGQYCNEHQGGLPLIHKKKTCDWCLCSEIQAYAAEPQFLAVINDPQGQIVIANGAVNSCFQKDAEGIRTGPCKDKTRDQMLTRAKELFKECAIPLTLK